MDIWKKYVIWRDWYNSCKHLKDSHSIAWKKQLIIFSLMSFANWKFVFDILLKMQGMSVLLNWRIEK